MRKTMLFWFIRFNCFQNSKYNHFNMLVSIVEDSKSSKQSWKWLAIWKIETKQHKNHNIFYGPKQNVQTKRDNQCWWHCPSAIPPHNLPRHKMGKWTVHIVLAFSHTHDLNRLALPAWKENAHAGHWHLLPTCHSHFACGRGLDLLSEERGENVGRSKREGEK